MNPKLIKFLLISVFCSIVVNGYYFIIGSPAMPTAELAARHKKENAGDPLLSPVTYRPLVSKRRSSDSEESGDTASGKKKAKNKVESPQFKIERKGGSEITSDWQALVLNEHMKGEITVFAGLSEVPERIRLKFQTAFPSQLSDEELFAGKKEIWLKEIAGELRPTSLESEDGSLEFKGQLRGLIEVAQREYRAPAIGRALLKLEEDGTYSGKIIIKRSSQDAPASIDGERVFATKDSRGFLVHLRADFRAIRSEESSAK